MKTKFKKGDLIQAIGETCYREGGLYGIIVDTNGRRNGTVFVRWQFDVGVYPHYAGGLKLVARANEKRI